MFGSLVLRVSFGDRLYYLTTTEGGAAIRMDSKAKIADAKSTLEPETRFLGANGYNDFDKLWYCQGHLVLKLTFVLPDIVKVFVMDLSQVGRGLRE